jgi:CubicO group peptidase (beta-lactamase class C family)
VLAVALTSLNFALHPAALPTTLEFGLPVRSPAEVGMSAERLASIERLVLRGVQAGGYPGAAVTIGRHGYSVLQQGYGRISWAADAPRVNSETTLFDLASLTKVVGTTTAIMVLYDDGKLRLTDRVSKYLPEFGTGDKALVTIEQLLVHRFGLPAGLQLWLKARTPMKARDVVLHTPLRCRPGTCFMYSDLGADVLGFVVEKISGRKLDQFLGDRIFSPLAMTSTMFRPPPSLRSLIAPTEVAPPRGYRIQGEVHDESAFALGGVSGHAGLFSTADDLSVFAQMMLNGGEYNGVRVVADSTVSLFTRRTAGSRALGWDTANGEAGAGQFLSPRAYGHTGYTGTSLWIDPERQLFVVLLTNRVHAPKVRQPGYLIADVRNDLMDAAVLSVMDQYPGVLELTSTFRSDTATYWDAKSVPKGTRSSTGR